MAGKKKQRTEEPPVIPPQSTALNLINNLNNDCLVKIFKYLDIKQRLIVEGVCKRWKEVSELPWDDIKVLKFRKSKSWDNDPAELSLTFPGRDCFTTILKRCGHSMEQLELGDTCPSSVLPLVGQHCQNLLKLTVEFERVYGRHYTQLFPQLIPKMHLLTYLEIENVSDFFDINFFRSLPGETLTELRLKMKGGEFLLTDRVHLNREHRSIFENLKRLTAFTLDGFVFQLSILHVISQKPNITSLSIANCSVGGELSDLKLLVNPNLEHLTLTFFSEHMNDAFLLHISKICKKLKSLNLKGFEDSLSNKGLTKLLKLSHLETLILNDVSNITDLPLSKMHNLKRLECEDCREVRDKGIFKLLNNAPNLQFLNLAGSNVTPRVLCEAARVTNRRTNNLHLQVFISRDVGNVWNRRESIFARDDIDLPRLTVKMRNDVLIRLNDDSDDSSN